MLVAQHRTVRIVVKLNETRSPQNDHRKEVAEQHAHHGSQRGRPALYGPEQRVLPVQRADERPHLTPPAKKVRHARVMLVIEEKLITGPHSKARLSGFPGNVGSRSFTPCEPW